MLLILLSVFDWTVTLFVFNVVNIVNAGKIRCWNGSVTSFSILVTDFSISALFLRVNITNVLLIAIDIFI